MGKARRKAEESRLVPHGASNLPFVSVDSYSLEIKDKDGFIGDKASKGAFRELMDKWRKPLRDLDLDPFGDVPSADIPKDRLTKLLAGEDHEKAGFVQSVLEDFAQQLAAIIRRFIALKEWRGTERIVIGGGFQASQVGKVAVGRALLILRDEKIKVEIDLIKNDSDHAGLIGSAYLLPPWMFKGHDAFLAVDIGGTNIRAGVVAFTNGKSKPFSDLEVAKIELWRHANEAIKRDDAAGRIAGMLTDLIEWAKKKGLKLVPVIGVGCPGHIEANGSIKRGAQNLPGNWESSRFNLPDFLCSEIPKIDGEETLVVMHNDAVIQGLSDYPQSRGYKRWAVLTIGTGLGNARFTTRAL
ncbi:MAG: ROK family protein [Rhizobiales bacterium]|nr:ROK family protein [Hyphomicrobiales bacterium]